MNTMKKQDNTNMMNTGLAPDYEEQPSAFGMTNGQQTSTIEDDGFPSSDRILLQIDDVYVTNRLCSLVERTSAQIGELAKRVACGVALTGWMLNKARMAKPRGFGKLFGKDGGFSFSHQRGSQFLRCAAALHDRAVAAGVGEDFIAQMDAALEAFKANPNAIPSLPVMDALENDKWVSVHAMMLELGVVRPAKIRQLPQPQQPENSTPSLPGLEELCAQHWSTASKMLDSFHYFMREDAGNLNKQQRTELREHLKGLLAELDQLEATAPALM